MWFSHTQTGIGIRLLEDQQLYTADMLGASKGVSVGESITSMGAHAYEVSNLARISLEAPSTFMMT
jgi:hypothetical protein